MQASNFGGPFEKLFLWIFLRNFHRRCLSTSSLPWCKQVKMDQKLKSRGSCLNIFQWCHSLIFKKNELNFQNFQNWRNKMNNDGIIKWHQPPVRPGYDSVLWVSLLEQHKRPRRRQERDKPLAQQPWLTLAQPMKPKAKREHENKIGCLPTKEIWKARSRQKSLRIFLGADLWKMLKNSSPRVWLECIEFFSFSQHFSAFLNLMNAHFSTNSC